MSTQLYNLMMLLYFLFIFIYEIAFFQVLKNKCYRRFKKNKKMFLSQDPKFISKLLMQFTNATGFEKSIFFCIRSSTNLRCRFCPAPIKILLSDPASSPWFTSEGDHNDIVKQFQALHGTLYCGGSL